MKRIVSIISLFVVLVLLCIGEEILVNKATLEISNRTNKIDVLVTNEKILNQDKIWDSFNSLNDFWQENRDKVCYFVNFDKIRCVDESLEKLHDGIKNNDKCLAVENIAIIKSSGKQLHYFMGFQLNNLL